MKFLCVQCDEAMKLERVDGPEEGSLSVTFACAACGNRVAMLTNPWETQLVRALDVKVGERPDSAEPMEFVRTMLSSTREGALAAASETAKTEAAPAVSTELAAGASTELVAGSGCPFSAMINPAAEKSTITWDTTAERRLERVPDFIRPMARRGIERFAAERGYSRITEQVMDEARGALGL